MLKFVASERNRYHIHDETLNIYRLVARVRRKKWTRPEANQNPYRPQNRSEGQRTS